MRPARQLNALVLILGCSWAAGTPAADFTLTPAEVQRVEARQIVVRATLDSSLRRGTVRAALRIDAPPEVVYQMMLRCDDALEYVPHLRHCKVRDQAQDDSWVEVEHEIDFGWYAPRVNWTFRADLTAERRIAFRIDDAPLRVRRDVIAGVRERLRERWSTGSRRGERVTDDR